MGAGSCSGKRAWICMQPTATMLSKGGQTLILQPLKRQPLQTRQM